MAYCVWVGLSMVSIIFTAFLAVALVAYAIVLIAEEFN